VPVPVSKEDELVDVYNRYVLPSFVERTSYGVKESNPYNKMFEERIIFHQPATEGGYAQGSDIEIQAREILRMRTQLEEMLARHSNQPVEKVRRDIDRDKFLTANEAQEYGLVDKVLTSRKKTLASAGSS
jgi:ATP-dependent protease ClpP protease subunit